MENPNTFLSAFIFLSTQNCWHAHKDLKQCPPLEYSTFCHFCWMSPNFKSMHMSWNKSYVIYKSNRASFLGPQDKYCLSVGLICWTTMVIGNHFKSERSRISIVGHKLTAGLEPYFANLAKSRGGQIIIWRPFWEVAATRNKKPQKVLLAIGPCTKVWD